MLEYFGDRWDAPRLDRAVQISTPVGAPCLFCREPIADGDRGLVTSVIYELAQEPVREFAHAECELADGLLYGVCPCTGFNTCSRAAARELWSRVMNR